MVLNFEKWITAILTHFRSVFHFYTPWKRQKTIVFQAISGVIEMEHWLEMG